MKVTKQIDLDAAKSFGIAGRDSSEINNQLQSIIRETDDNIDQRESCSTYKFFGIQLVLPKSALRPVEKCCYNDGTRYPFLFRKQGDEFIKALIRHYLFDEKLISADDSAEIIDRSVKACHELGIEPDKISSNLSYLKTWIIYKCNQILTNYIS